MNNGSFFTYFDDWSSIGGLISRPFYGCPFQSLIIWFRGAMLPQKHLWGPQKKRKRNKKNLLIIVMYNYLSLYLFSIIYGCFMDKAYMCIAIGRWETGITKQGLSMSPLKIAPKNIFWGD
jgi:hypothetical protein